MVKNCRQRSPGRFIFILKPNCFEGDAGVQKSPYVKFRQNSSAGYGGGAIIGKIRNGQKKKKHWH